MTERKQVTQFAVQLILSVANQRTEEKNLIKKFSYTKNKKQEMKGTKK